MKEEDYFWKNFRLGTELQISGNFIYNGLYFFDKLEYIRFEEDIFEFLYNISVGLERVLKIAVVLLEHGPTVKQPDFERSLITHDHLELLKRIVRNKNINLGKIHTKFLGLTTDFYKSYRYQRFNRSSVYHKNFDKQNFLDFLSRELKIEIAEDDYIKNDQRVKNFIGKIISKIALEIYKIISDTARQIGTFTHEIRIDSKAFKIFMVKEFNFVDENNFKREILINLLSKKGITDEFIDYIKTIKPIELSTYNSSHYIKYLFNPLATAYCNDEYEYLKDEKKIPLKRGDDIDFIGESQYLSSEFDNFFDSENEEI